METLKNRIVKLLDILNERVYGKEEVMALALLSAVAGESIFPVRPSGSGQEYGSPPVETDVPWRNGFRIPHVAVQYSR